jgi:hypothetical protein
MMFAHAEFEHRVSDLVGVIADDPEFGEQPANRWSARARPKKVETLCAEMASKRLSGLPETDAIVKCLPDAIKPCHDRNLLTHGVWWAFDVDAGLIIVRADTVRDGEEQHRDFTIDAIQQIAVRFYDLEAELYNLQRTIEARLPRE